jgi:hypothetical protein
MSIGSFIDSARALSYQDGVRSCATLAALERFGRTRHLEALAEAFTAAHAELSDFRGEAGHTIDPEIADSVPGIRELIEVTLREAAASAAHGGVLLLAALGSSAVPSWRARHFIHAERLVISACAMAPAVLSGMDRMCWLGGELHQLNVGLWANAVADEFAEAVNAEALAHALSDAIDTSGATNSAMLALRAEWWTPVTEDAADIPELVALTHAAREHIAPPALSLAA